MDYLENQATIKDGSQKPAKQNADNLWGNVLKKMRSRVSRHVFETWFKQTKQVALGSNQIVVEVPSLLYQQMFEEKYANQIQEVVEDVAQHRMDISYQIASPNMEDAGPLFHDIPNSQTTESNPALVTTANGTAQPLLQPHYVFDRFIVGPSNQFAHAAALAVSNNPSRSYNPLYLHGGVGLGKTHLMHAIGNFIHVTKPHLKILYVQSEQFTNEVITHIRYDRMQEFREKYRNVDVLLIDDIQFIAGKDSTVSEFFHTFNTLYNSQKQIVISSDQPPRSISNLEERIRSRFEWGLIADIQPPGLETKAAILQKKAEELKLDLPNEIALYIASKVKSNIRELEGSLLNIAARVSLTGARVNLEVAAEALKQFASDSDKIVTVEMVQKQVSVFYDIKVSALRSKGRTMEVTIPRQIAMYLSREMTQQSLSEIGKRFGGRNHTTVIHACRRIEDDMVRNSDLKNQVNLIRSML